MSLLDEMASDADAGVGIPIPRDEDFRTISELVDEQLKLEGEIESLEASLKTKKEDLRRIERGALPAAILKFGLTEFKLVDESIVTVKEDIRCGITAERYDEAMRWLEQTGNDDIIKNEVSSSFGKGQDADAATLISLLNDRGFSFENHRHVHPQTLKAFVRKQIEDGNPVPVETFSVFIDKVAKIKLPRKR